jgi:hypothetical protein
LIPRLLIALVFLSSLHAADKPSPISPQVKAAIDKAVLWLMTQQKPEGFFTEHQRVSTPKPGQIHQHAAAMTALSLMGLTAVGHMPSDTTPQGQAAAKGLKFMADYIIPDKNGYLAVSDNSRMYGHGIINLMFVEMLGMHPDEDVDRKVRSHCENGVRLILSSQKAPKSDASKGGWRYQPEASDADMSVTVWQLMTLRAAKNSGIEVPSQAIADAVSYVKRSYRSERDALGRIKDMASGFTYEPYGGNPRFSTAAAGMLSLQVCGQYESPEVLGCANFLMKNPPEPNESWFYYGNYYYAQAMYQRGGDFAAAARRRSEDLLLKAQDSSGAWIPRNGNEKSQGPVYATSLALLSLSVYHHFLPIYQK